VTFYRPSELGLLLHDVFVEDCRKELAELQTLEARRIFILAKANLEPHAQGRNTSRWSRPAAADLPVTRASVCSRAASPTIWPSSKGLSA
jgi:hypothetical protein